MRIISKKRLRDFWETRKADASAAERDLTAWLRIVEDVKWGNFGELRQTFGHRADVVGNCVVFDVGNNRFRLIARLNYRRGVLYVLKIMDHKEYDRNDWKHECGCHQPPPRIEPPRSYGSDEPTGRSKKP